MPQHQWITDHEDALYTAKIVVKCSPQPDCVLQQDLDCIVQKTGGFEGGSES